MAVIVVLKDKCIAGENAIYPSKMSVSALVERGKAHAPREGASNQFFLCRCIRVREGNGSDKEVTQNHRERCSKCKKR